MIENAKILVTGGSGFIGSNLCNKLLTMDYQVRVLDNFSTGKKENIIPFMNNKNFDLIEGDIRSFHIVREAVKGIDYILHQCALPSVPRSISDPITTNEVNILGTLNILEAAKEFEVKRVVFASSSSVYGNKNQLPKSEDMKVEPMSPYAITKYAGERYCEVFYQLYGLETVVLRYFNVFGPNQDPLSQYSAVLPKFINLMINDISPIIYGDGHQSRDFTFIENVVEAIILALCSKQAVGEVINIACGESNSLLNLVDKINKYLGKSIEIKFMDDRPGDIKHSLSSIEKAKDLLAYTPKIDFIKGIEMTIEKILSKSKL